MTNKQTNRPTDYYTRGRPRAHRVINSSATWLSARAQEITRCVCIVTAALHMHIYGTHPFSELLKRKLPSWIIDVPDNGGPDNQSSTAHYKYLVQSLWLSWLWFCVLLDLSIDHGILVLSAWGCLVLNGVGVSIEGIRWWGSFSECTCTIQAVSKNNLETYSVISSSSSAAIRKHSKTSIYTAYIYTFNLVFFYKIHSKYHPDNNSDHKHYHQDNNHSNQPAKYCKGDKVEQLK